MKRTLVSVFALLLSYYYPAVVQASWNTTEFKNFTVTVEYRDYSYQEASGDAVYTRPGTVAYRVVIHNNGHRPFRDLPVKATLVWDKDAVCTMPNNATGFFYASQQLPGNSVSGPHLLTIGGESYSFFDGFYTIPDNVCPNAVRVQLDAGRDSTRYPSLLLPDRFIIR